MTTDSASGPFGQMAIPPQAQAPWYVITFDAAGRCTSPLARGSLIEAARSGAYRHVIVFSHGWNNTWADVEGLNRSLIGAVTGVWPAQDAAAPSDVLVVSIFWPSVALLAEDEHGPTIAAGGDDTEDRHALDALADALPKAKAKRLRSLTAQPELSEAQAGELAELLASLLKGKDEVGAPAPTADELQTIVRAVEQPSRNREGTIVEPTDDVWAGIGSGPAAANTLGWSWRTPVRVATVYLMKKRAGLVGARGVSPLLQDLLESGAELHLGGHSYGCRVMLSAICAARPSRPYSSLLLLQPAVSRYCFAEKVPTSGRPGGYRPALDRVRQPILLTHSANDAPLHKMFGLAMFLAKDIGEPEIASAYDNIYAALGGYGPAGVEFAQLSVQAPGQPYPLDGAARLIALDGSTPVDGAERPAINDHGDVTTPYTGWMLYCQLRAGQEGAHG